MQTTLPIEIITLEDKSYHIMIEAIFQQNIAGNLILDTGASKTVFDYDFVEPFIEDIQEVEDDNSSGINAMITQAKIGIIPNITFKKLVLNDFQSLLLDLSHINNLYQKHTNKQIAGLIGSDFLVEYNAIINYGKNILTLNH